jgi:hypothetical protein
MQSIVRSAFGRNARGLPRARITQIMDLTMLAPEIQEHVLLNGEASHVKLLHLMAVALAPP